MRILENVDMDYLNGIKQILSELNIVTDIDFFKSKKNRKKLYNRNPDAFLSISKDGIPTFPVRNQANCNSWTILKRSLRAAKRLRATNEDDPELYEKYDSICKVLERKILNMETKVSIRPIIYKTDKSVMDIITNRKVIT